MKKPPKVSILCTTFNHEKFIRQALDSFLMQKTNFDFEVLIYDDASTDKTVEIIKEFKQKNPKMFRVFYQKENQYSKGVRGIMTKFLLPFAEGDYVAPCEGDDYFSDENKLQKQVDFLDKNSDCSMCFHRTRWFFANNEEPDSVYPDITNGTEFTIKRLLKENFMNTNAVMYRRQNYSEISKKDIMPGDWYLHLFHAQFGKIGFIDKIMATYRRHNRGIWYNAYHDQDKLLIEQGIYFLAFYFELAKIYGHKKSYKEIIDNHIINLLKKFNEIDKKYKTNYVEKSLISFSSQMATVLNDFIIKIDLSDKIINEKTRKLESMEKQNQINNYKIIAMESSKFWKLRKRYINLKKKIIHNAIIFNKYKKN